MRPQDVGAQCERCPLQAKHKLPITNLRDALLVVVSDSPYQGDDDEPRPLRADQHRTLKRVIESSELPWSKVCSTCAVSCPGLYKLTPALRTKAIQCCSPRLNYELDQTQATVVSLGDVSFRALGGTGSVERHFGQPRRTHGLPWLPSLDITSPQRGPLVAELLRRAVALTEGTLTPWKWPEIITQQDSVLATRLWALGNTDAPLAVDVETTGISSRESSMWALGFGTEHYGVSIAWPPKDPETRRMAERILSSGRSKVFHNAAFDLNVLKAHGLEVRGEVHDTMLLHTVIAPELPHRLDFVAAQEFPIENWKEAYREGRQLDWANLTQEDRDQGYLYNARDCVVTARLLPKLLKRLSGVHQGQSLYDQYRAVQKVTAKMTWNGCLVDPVVREHYSVDLQREATELAGRFRGLVPAGYDLGSNGNNPSIKALFFDHFRVQPRTWTDTGLPQCDVNLLQEVGERGGEAGEVAKLVLRYRKVQKLYQTYVRDLVVGLDGRVRPSWNGTGARSGRWSCSGPNFQNFPKGILRDMLVPPPGCFIVEADFNALELRIAALVSHASKLLYAFQTGVDVHAQNAQKVFKVESPTKAQRDAAKTVAFGSLYNASSDCTVMHKALRAKYPQITYQMVERVRRWFLHEEHTELRRWQIRQIEFARSEGYAEEPLSGRRRYFFGQPDDNKALNHPIQAMAAELTNRAILAVDRLLDPDRGEHIVFQIHDAIYLIGPDPERLKAILREGMVQTVELDGDRVTFEIETKTGLNFGAMK